MAEQRTDETKTQKTLGGLQGSEDFKNYKRGNSDAF